MFGDGLVIAKSPEDFKEKIDYYLENEEERKTISQIGHDYVKKNHTGFHRIAKIMKEFDYEDLSDTIITKYEESINEN